MNLILLIGRLTADPELRYTNTGTAVASFTLAVDRPQRKDHEKETDFVNIVVWGKSGENCAQYLGKGRQAAIEGRLQIRSYENRDGQKVRVAEVVANNVQFLDRANSGNGSTGNNNKSNNNGNGRPASAPSAQRAQQGNASSDSFDDPFADNGSEYVDIMDDDLPF